MSTMIVAVFNFVGFMSNRGGGGGVSRGNSSGSGQIQPQVT